MAANAAQDLVRALAEGDAPRVFAAIPLNRMRNRHAVRANANALGLRAPRPARSPAAL
jgi:hypothetical protein